LGWPEQGHDAYDAVLDYAAALLTAVLDDKAALPDIADLIFRRNRSGVYIHDLVWAFFQTLETDALRLTALRLKSNDARDAELAGRLLHLELPLFADRRARAEVYDTYIHWLDANGPYLYLTGEHFQMTSRPNHLDVDREAKYLDKPISPRDRTPNGPLTGSELASLDAFRQMPEDERELLAQYSQKLRSDDKRLWTNG
jgi:hypothetical protein